MRHSPFSKSSDNGFYLRCILATVSVFETSCDTSNNDLYLRNTLAAVFVFETSCDASNNDLYLWNTLATTFSNDLFLRNPFATASNNGVYLWSSLAIACQVHSTIFAINPPHLSLRPPLTDSLSHRHLTEPIRTKFSHDSLFLSRLLVIISSSVVISLYSSLVALLR